MPHECTNCGRRFEDGSKEMLSGCPDCGGNKFQFRPKSAGGDQSDAGTDTTDADRPRAPSDDAPPADPNPIPGDAAASADDPFTDPDLAADDLAAEDADDSDIIEADPDPDLAGEDRAQADARSGFVSADELQTATESTTETQTADAEDTETKPDLSELRAELNEQFESIKVLNPGQYELNLMELYDREEYIISLREDGRYVIEVPESWRRGDGEA
jgi:hypothetical protein